MVNTCTNIIQGILPRQCLLCQQTGHHFGLCHACIEQLPWNPSACPQCALPIPTDSTQVLCGRCQSRPPPFQATHAAFLYGHPVDYLVQQVKFHHNLACARSLGELLANSIQEAGLETEPELIIPVPLHSQRLRQRGFNQAQELSRPLSRLLGIPVDIKSCERIRATEPQSDLLLSQRKANIRDAFRVSGAIKARRVAIVDDVMTSGHTVSSLARLLNRHGVEHISVWCAARTVY